MIKNIFNAFKFTAILWIIEIFHVFMPFNIKQHGIYPRETKGLKGILFAPFLHADWRHLALNTVPLTILLVFIYSFYKRISFQIIAFSIVIGGFLIWLVGRSTNHNGVSTSHIGASALVYSLAAFLIFSGIFRKSFKSIIVACIVIFVFGIKELLLGLSPTQTAISWEGHLMGAIAGIFLAYVYRRENKPKEVYTEVYYE